MVTLIKTDLHEGLHYSRFDSSQIEDENMSCDISRRENDVVDNVKEGNVVNENIPAEKASLFNRIKEAWQNEIMDTVKTDLEEIATLSSTEVIAFCEFVDFSVLSENSIEIICRNMAETGEYFELHKCYMYFDICSVQ